MDRGGLAPVAGEVVATVFIAGGHGTHTSQGERGSRSNHPVAEGRSARYAALLARQDGLHLISVGWFERSVVTSLELAGVRSGERGELTAIKAALEPGTVSA